jgi:hypothetical protein
MRLPALLLAAIVVAIAPKSAAAAEVYCPNRAHAGPAKVPAELATAFAMAFQIDAAAVGEGTFVRSAGPKTLGCYVGANLNCFKADRRRTLPGATAFCRGNPGSQGIPAAATGHDTIYDWSCDGRRAVAGKIVLAVDPQGYVADNWKELP